MQTLIFALLFVANNGASAQVPTYPARIPARACIESICGTPAQSQSINGSISAKVAELASVARTAPERLNYPDSIQQLFDELEKVEKKSKATLAARLAASKPLNQTSLEGTAKAFYNFKKGLGLYSKMAFLPIPGSGTPQLDEKKSRENLKDLSPEDLDWAIAFAREYIGSLPRVTPERVKSTPPQVLLKQLYPELETTDALKFLYRLAKINIKMADKGSYLLDFVYFYKTPPERIDYIGDKIENGVVNEDDIREILLFNANFKISSILESSVLMKNDTPPVEDLIKALGGLDDIVEKSKQWRDKSLKEEQDLIESCKYVYHFNVSSLPTSIQITQLNDDIKRAKDLVKDLIRARMPPYLQQKLIDAVDAIKFLPPATSEEFRASFKALLQNKLKAAKALLARSEEAKPEELRMMFAAVTSSTDKTNEYNEPQNSYCDDFKYEPMSDGNYTFYNSVITSFTTATAPEEGRMRTLMHEVGHTLSKAMGEDYKGAELRSQITRCLSEVHPVSPSANSSVSNHVEEDFSDGVAGEGGKSIRSKNPWCPMLNLSSNRQQYLEFKLHANGSHSSGLFRLLRYEVIRKGNLPEVCQKILPPSHPIDRLRSCLDAGTFQEASANKAAQGGGAH